MFQMFSFWKKILVILNRGIDQGWRQLTGLPTLKRSMITPNIFLGGQYSFNRLSRLKTLGITAIVNMRISSITNPDFLKDFRYLHLPTVDQTAPSMENLVKGAQFIDDVIKQGGKVYIHCMAGEGRGPTMVMAYFIHSGMTFDDAFETVLKVRTFIRPSQAQKDQLKKFEKLKKSTSI